MEHSPPHAAYQKTVVPLAPLTDSEVVKTLSDMEDVIRFRLRTTEIIPVEISQHRIGMMVPLNGVLA